jgi:hypothetical protein
MMEVFNSGNEWCIVYGLRISTRTFEYAWDGENWGFTWSFAMRFPSRDEAEHYLAEHRYRMQDLLDEKSGRRRYR